MKPAFKIINKGFKYFIFFLLLFTGCNLKNKNQQGNQNYFEFSSFPKTDTLKFEQILFYKGGAAGMMKITDNNLIIFNVHEGAQYFLNNYSLESGQLSQGYLKSGRGPGESVGARGIGIIDGKLWIQDITVKKVLMTDLKNVLQDKIKSPFEEYRVEDDFYMIGFKDSLHFLGVGYSSSNLKIQEVDLKSGKIVNEFGVFDNIPNQIDSGAFKEANQCYIHVSHAGDKAVLVYRFSDIVEIYDLKSYKSIKIHGPEIFNVDFQPSGNKMFRTEKTRFAFVSGGGNVTENYLYLTYSGALTKSDNSYYAQKIFVYDWEGNPVRQLILDQYIEAIAVSNDDKILYAYDVYSGDLIKAYL